MYRRIEMKENLNFSIASKVTLQTGRLKPIYNHFNCI